MQIQAKVPGGEGMTIAVTQVANTALAAAEPALEREVDHCGRATKTCWHVNAAIGQRGFRSIGFGIQDGQIGTCCDEDMWIGCRLNLVAPTMDRLPFRMDVGSLETLCPTIPLRCS